MSAEQHLSRRERQIMDALHAKGQATAAEVLAALPDPPSYSAVRALLRILEDKGHISPPVLSGRARRCLCLGQHILVPSSLDDPVKLIARY